MSGWSALPTRGFNGANYAVAAALSMKMRQAKMALKKEGIEPIFEDARVETVLS